ncbi:MAG: tol-pal system-associated acyl-CoA thioesterase [Alphaproteobacteria bacterium]|nr:tol-pal system-associated acyl-CoA thioesterase [Alphaproteobacteria bacterium]
MGAETGSGQTNTSGWFEGACHVLPLRVYYEDTDAAGIVYYANYLRFAERARTEMMRCLGAEHSTLMVEQGIAFAVRNCDTEYLQPARLDDALFVKTRVREVRGASMRADQTVARREEDGAETELVRLHIRLACMDSELKPARLPRVVRESLGELAAEA